MFDIKVCCLSLTYHKYKLIIEVRRLIYSFCLKFMFEDDVRSSNLILKFEDKVLSSIWNQSLKLKFQVEVDAWNWSINFLAEVWSQSLRVEVEVSS